MHHCLAVLIHFTPLRTMATPLLLQRRCSPHDKAGLSPPWPSGPELCRYLMWLRLAQSASPQCAKRCVLMLFLAEGECRRCRVMWVLAFRSSAWKSSTAFLGLLQTPKRIWWCFPSVLSEFVSCYFSSVPLSQISFCQIWKDESCGEHVGLIGYKHWGLGWLCS